MRSLAIVPVLFLWARGACLAGESAPGAAPLAARLRERLGGLAADPAAGIDVRLRLRPGAPAAAVEEALSRLGGLELRRLPGVGRIEARLPVARLVDLGAHPEVEWVEERPVEDRDRDEADGLRKAVGLEALAVPGPLRGRGVLVGTWETGHADQQTLTGEFMGHDDLAGRIQTMEDSPATQHATQVAGVLAGSGRASEWRGALPFQWQGVAPAVRVLSYSTSDSDDEPEELLAAVRRARIHVALHSWGESVDRNTCELFGDYTIRAAEFDQAIAGGDPARAGEGGVPVVFSGGNYQNFLECPLRGGGEAIPIIPGYWTINPPHTAKNIIAAGAVNSNDLSMTTFSSWGPTDDGRIKPDLVAPGAQRGGDVGITSPTFEPPDAYRPDQGTSYAAAAIAGTLSILISERSDRGAPALPPAAWKALLVQSALDLTADPFAPRADAADPPDPGANPYRGPDFIYGFGLVQVPAALRISQSGASLIEGTVSTGETRRFLLEVPAAGTIRATLAWDDPPGNPALLRTLVNDLDLRILEELEDGAAVTHFPWTLDPAAPDQPARRGNDRANNVEQVEIDFSAGGRLLLLVTGAEVVRGPQRFWVAVCSGCALLPESTARFRRGDANADGGIDIADPIAVFSHLFLAGEIPCRDACDTNDDGRLDIADSVRLLSFLFLGSLPPGAPRLNVGCDLDRTFDTLGCAVAPACP